MQFSAASIIGKTLTAKQPISIKRAASDSAATVYTVAPGQSVGVVYSYLLPAPGRNTLYWQFLDNTGRAYYAAHSPTAYSLTAIQQQGGKSLEQEQKEQERKNETLTDWLKRNTTTAVLIIAGAIVLKSVLPALINKK
jgi:lambda repressor-like predicted transcriptional regulator